jgi:hypothetical protein
MDAEAEARAKIVGIGAEIGLYFVLWRGHFGTYFVGVRNGRGFEPEVYSAIYESYYDFVRDDEKAFRFDVKTDADGGFRWADVLRDLAPYAVKSAVERPFSAGGGS